MGRPWLRNLPASTIFPDTGTHPKASLTALSHSPSGKKLMLAFKCQRPTAVGLNQGGAMADQRLALAPQGSLPPYPGMPSLDSTL